MQKHLETQKVYYTLLIPLKNEKPSSANNRRKIIDLNIKRPMISNQFVALVNYKVPTNSFKQVE